MIAKTPLERIDPNPWQTRRGDPDPEYVKELALDIAKNGLLQTPLGRLIHSDGSLVNAVGHSDPVGVMAAGTDIRVQLAFGHNRLAAFRWLYDLRDNSDLQGDYSSMPVEIRPLNDEQMADFAWSENERRRDHSPIERALAIQKRIDDFGWSQKDVADHLGISRPVVSNALRLLKLPDEIQECLVTGNISERIALALVGLQDLPESIYKLAEDDWGETKPSAIVKGALDGRLTSDNIRELTQRVCTRFGQNLAEAGWPLDEIASANADLAILRSVTCRDCEQRIKDRNICLDKDCYAHRKTFKQSAYLQAASQVSGIPVVEDGKEGRYGNDITRLYSWRFEKSGFTQKVLASGCENLRLHYRSYLLNDGKYEPDSVPGYPYAQIICQKRPGYCRCITALESTEIVKSEYNDETQKYDQVVIQTGLEVSDQPSAEELSQVASEAKELKKDARSYAKEIVQYIGERIGDELRAKNTRAWKKLAAGVHYKCGQEERNVTDVQDAIGRQFAEKGLPYEFSTPVEVERAMIKLLESFGAGIDIEKFPTTMALKEDRMAKLKAESDAIAAQCKAEGKTLVDLFAEQEAEA